MFEVGQRWKNIDDIIYVITHITSGKIVYKTSDDIGFQIIEAFEIWKEIGAIELIENDRMVEPLRCKDTIDMFN